MVRTVDRRLSFWIAHYYDDFNAARSIADDLNNAEDTPDHTKSHHGNPMNGEAFLSPRYRYTFAERHPTLTGTVLKNKIIASEDRLKHNKGIHEWASHDPTRLDDMEWEGYSQLQYPDSNIANRQKYASGAGGSSTGYLWFCNGYSSQQPHTGKPEGRYWVKGGDSDSSFSREKLNTLSPRNDTSYTGEEGKPETGRPSFSQQSSLVGVFMGERPPRNKSSTTSGANEALEVLQPIKSPGGKPFLCIQTYNSGSTAHPQIAYEGDLNSKGDGDIFNLRLSWAHMTSIAGAASGNYTLYVGFDYDGTGVSIDQDGYNATGKSNAAITHTFNPNTGAGLDAAKTALFIKYAVDPTPNPGPYSVDDTWFDFDFIIDYTAYTYDIRVDGVIVSSSVPLGTKVDSTNFTPSEMYGWQLNILSDIAPTADESFVTLIDRAAMYRPLTDHPAGTALPPTSGFSLKSGLNMSSQCSLTILDDDNQLSLTEIVSPTTYSDSELLVFRDRIDRPIWRGFINSIRHQQQATKQTKQTTISAYDALTILSRELITWEIGQSAIPENAAIKSRQGEVQALSDSLYMGVRKLQPLNATLGLGKQEDFEEVDDQRMQLGSAHPIQMYLNEDTNGPNDAEDIWETTVETVGPFAKDGTTLHMVVSDKTDFTASNTFRIKGTENYNGTHTATSKTTVTVSSTTHDVITEASGTYTGIGIDQWVTITGPPDKMAFVIDDVEEFFKSFNIKVGDLIGFNGRVPDVGSPGTKTFAEVLAVDTDSVGRTRVKIDEAGGVTVTNNGTFSIESGNTPGNSKTRPLHARWIRDIGQSKWFKKQFGVIDEQTGGGGDTTTAFTAGTTTSITVDTPHPYFSLQSGGQFQIKDGNGAIDAGIADSATVATTVSIVLWLQGIYNSKSVASATFSDMMFVAGGGSVANPVVGQAIAVTGATDTNYNGIWFIHRVLPGIGIFSCLFVKEPVSGTHAGQSSGVQQEQLLLYSTASSPNRGSIHFGNSTLTLPTNNLLTRDHVSGEQLDARTISNEYKHIYILWADMRNNGEADADGTFRKTKFGTVFPLAENYQVSLVYADQNLSDETPREVFTDLKLNEEIDIWECDASNEPVTGNAWSAITLGSNSETDTQYHNWETKAGSFLVIDTSRFFNLNTEANRGAVGQISGGRKDLGEYMVEVAGVPVLIDNYWRQVPGTYENTEHPMTEHANQFRFINDVTGLQSDVLQNQTVLELMDITKWPDTAISGGNADKAGLIVCTNSKGQNQSSQKYYYIWDGRLAAEVTGTHTATPSSTTVLTDSGGDFVNDGVVAGMVIRNITDGSSGKITGVATTTITCSAGLSGGTDNDWDTNDSYIIYPQLKDVYITTGNFATYDAVLAHFNDATVKTKWTNGSEAAITLKDPNATNTSTTTGVWDQIDIYNSLSNIFPMRLMMQMDGFTTSPSSGTFWEHDKVRALLSLGTSSTWLSQSGIHAIADINNVPITRQMSTTQLAYTGASNEFDDYGSVADVRGKTVYNALKEFRGGSGIGYTNGVTTTFSLLMGRDARIDYRPKYNSGWVFNRNNLKISDLTVENTGQVTNVRCYYNGGLSFVDHPSPTLGSRHRWKVIDYSNVRSHEEAQFLAKQEFQRNQQARFNVQAKVVPLNDAHTFKEGGGKMLKDARYGYIADPCRTTIGGEMEFWTAAEGGCLFPGMTNALNGNILATGTYGVGASDESVKIGGTGNWKNPWWSSYYWYGAASLAHAVQVVHLPNEFPKASDASSEELRWCVTLTGNGTLAQPEFIVEVGDFQFDATRPTSSGPDLSWEDGGAVLQALTTTSLTIRGGGFYEIGIPSGYWSAAPAGAKIIISVNYEYLKSLLRHRCGDTTSADILKNAHVSPQTNSGVTGNASSIFPLGMRRYTDWGGFADLRTVWYAPRLHVVDDINFIPGTIIDYTDAYLNLTNEKLVIQDLTWTVNQRSTEEVTFNLERDESRFRSSIAGWIIPAIPGGNRQGDPSGGGNTRGRGGGDSDGGGSPGEWGSGYFPGTWGSELPSSKSGSEITRSQQRDDYGTGRTPGVVRSGGSGSGLSNLSGVNNLTTGAHRRFTGAMDLLSDRVSGESSGVPGTSSATQSPKSKHSMDATDTQQMPTSGGTTIGFDGITLPGAIDADTEAYHEHITTVRVPTDASDGPISIEGLASVGGTTGTAYVITKVECVETGKSDTFTQTIANSTSRSKVVLFPDLTVPGANTPGNTLKITIHRKPGDGTDDALYSSVRLHTMEIGFTKQHVRNDFSYGGHMKPYD